MHYTYILQRIKQENSEKTHENKRGHRTCDFFAFFSASSRWFEFSSKPFDSFMNVFSALQFSRRNSRENNHASDPYKYLQTASVQSQSLAITQNRARTSRRDLSRGACERALSLLQDVADYHTGWIARDANGEHLYQSGLHVNTELVRQEKTAKKQKARGRVPCSVCEWCHRAAV